MKQKRINRNLALLAMIAFWIFPSYFGDSFAGQKAAKRGPKAINKSAVKVIDLRNTDQVKEAFQRDKGKIRLITILSPT